MPMKVYNNVEDHRLLDSGRVCEDVTRVGLPTLTHSSTTISAAGMVMDVDMPNTTHLDSMEFTVTHNNGVNCQYLCNPGKHSLEFRLVRQRYNVAQGEIEHESVKYRIIGVFKEAQKGDVETNSPLGNTVKFSVLRYEEEIAGQVVTVIDAMAGIIKVNNVEYTSEINSLLA